MDSFADGDDDDSQSSQSSQSCTSGYATPPLSPSKTVSTEGWLSPKTPASPYRTLEYLFHHDREIHDCSEASLDSSQRIKFAARSVPFQLPDTPEFGPDVDITSPNDDLSETNPLVCVDETGGSHDVTFSLSTGHFPPRDSSPRRI